MSFQKSSRNNYSTEKKENSFDQADVHLCFTNLHFNRLSKKIGDEHTKIVDSVTDYSFSFYTVYCTLFFFLLCLQF